MLSGTATLSIGATSAFSRIKCGVASRIYGFDSPIDDPETPENEHAGLANYIIEQLTDGIPTRFYFCVSNEGGDSNEVSRVVTRRRADRPRPPRIQSFDLEIEGDDPEQPDVEFTFEVTQ